MQTVEATDPNVIDADAPRLGKQNAMVLHLLQSGVRLGPQTAADFNITRLSARIHDLRNAGYEINSIKRHPSTKCAVYWMTQKGVKDEC